jgi:hypothetical protein
MKTTSLIPACVAATLFLAPLLSAAEPTPSAEGSSDPKPQRHAQWVKQWDKNGDGKLDDSERAAAKQAMGDRKHMGGKGRERMLQRFDKDGDGVLNETERAAAAEDLSSRPRVLKRFDADGDGKLNDQEKAAAKQALIERRKGGE